MACLVISTFCNSTYVIEGSFSLTFIIINDMKGLKKGLKKYFKSKSSSPGSIQRPGPTTLASTLITSTADLRPSIPQATSDATASAQVIAGVSVNFQFRLSHLWSIDLMLSSRPPIISESLPRFRPCQWGSVIFLL